MLYPKRIMGQGIEIQKTNYKQLWSGENSITTQGFWQAYVLNNCVTNFYGGQIKKDKIFDTKL